jgi:hypothetical protein
MDCWSLRRPFDNPGSPPVAHRQHIDRRDSFASPNRSAHEWVEPPRRDPVAGASGSSGRLSNLKVRCSRSAGVGRTGLGARNARVAHTRTASTGFEPDAPASESRRESSTRLRFEFVCTKNHTFTRLRFDLVCASQPGSALAKSTSLRHRSNVLRQIAAVGADDATQRLNSPARPECGRSRGGALMDRIAPAGPRAGAGSIQRSSFDR